MHLDEAVPVGVGPVDDEVDVAVVLLELRPLAEVLGVLDGQGVESEGLAQQLELLGRRPVQVEPEELVTFQVFPHYVAIDDRVRSGLVDEKALVVVGHRSLRLQTRAARASRLRSALHSRLTGGFLGPAPGRPVAVRRS